jgi:hypothetical protein
MTPLGLNLTRLVLFLVLLAAAAAGTAAADDPPPSGPTLQGENLVAPFAGLTVTSNCNELGTSTVSYTANGAATGPFPGTFTASGTITIGPQLTPVLPPPLDGEPLFTGPIVALTETFTILSAGTTITGTKTLTQPLAELGESERATCQDVLFAAGIIGTGRVVNVQAATTYQATIQTPPDTFQDSGRATPVLTLTEISNPLQSSNSGSFDQLFTLSDQTEPPPEECDDDNDDQGDDSDCDEDPGDQ